MGNNIKMYVKEIEREDVGWINLAKDRDRWQAAVNTVKNLQVL